MFFSSGMIQGHGDELKEKLCLHNTRRDSNFDNGSINFSALAAWLSDMKNSLCGLFSLKAAMLGERAPSLHTPVAVRGGLL